MTTTTPTPPRSIKYAYRVHSWSAEATHSCIYLDGDPKQTPIISGMLNARAKLLCDLLNTVWRRSQKRDGPTLARLGQLVTDFEQEAFGRNAWPTDE